MTGPVEDPQAEIGRIEAEIEETEELEYLSHKLGFGHLLVPSFPATPGGPRSPRRRPPSLANAGGGSQGAAAGISRERPRTPPGRPRNGSERQSEVSAIGGRIVPDREAYDELLKNYEQHLDVRERVYANTQRHAHSYRESAAFRKEWD